MSIWALFAACSHALTRSNFWSVNRAPEWVNRKIFSPLLRTDMIKLRLEDRAIKARQSIY